MMGGEAHPETRRMMETAIRRLNVLEYVILGVAMALALLAGALAAWMVENVTGAPFRPTWAVSSLLFFIVPGWIVLRRERRAGAGGTTEPTEATGTAGTVSPGDSIEKRDDGRR
jgi:hypothetical protein